MSTSKSSLLNLFDVLNAADELTLCDDDVGNWVHEFGSDPETFRLDTSDRFYRFEDQLVGLDQNGCFYATTHAGDTVSLTAMVKRVLTAEDVLKAMQS